jgi:hypothetical protein
VAFVGTSTVEMPRYQQKVLAVSRVLWQLPDVEAADSYRDLAAFAAVIGRLRIPLEVPNGGAGGNRTPVHKSYATRSTYVATSIVLTAHYPTGRESMQPAR